jgi:GntR family transcriptional regulator
MAKTLDLKWLPQWPLERKRGSPLYIQVEAFLRELIRSHRFADGELLPDEITLAKQLGVSLGTLRNSLGRLVDDGVVERRAGVGTRVVQRPVESGIVAWRSFSREMRRRGIEVQALHLKVTQAPVPPSAARALKIDLGTPVIHLERVRGWDNIPMQHALTWFHPRLGLSGKEDFREPLYDLIKATTGFDAEQAHEEFEALGADAEMANYLRVKKGTPLLGRSQTTFDLAGNPIDHTEIRYRTDNFKLQLDLSRGPS